MSTVGKYVKNSWIIKNPAIMYRIARGFTRALFRKNTLRSIEVFPTMHCNARCVMCSIEKYKKSVAAPLTLKEYESLADQGAALGAFALHVLGGEPLLYPHLTELIRIFKQRKFLVMTITNALLATPEKLQALQKAGLDIICFSLDNADREKNDEIRGTPGHYDAVHKAIEITRDLGMEPRIAVVFFPGRMAEGMAVYEHAKRLGLKVSSGQVAPVGGWEGKPVLSPAEHDQVRELLRRDPYFTTDWSTSYYFRQRCPGGKEKIAISNYGDVFGCSVNPISFGNVREESLATLLERTQCFSQFSKNASICLSAEDSWYQEKYLAPLSGFAHYPVAFSEHPFITPENEPALFKHAGRTGARHES